MHKTNPFESPPAGCARVGGLIERLGDGYQRLLNATLKARWLVLVLTPALIVGLARQFAAVNPICSPFASMLLLRVLRIFAIGENARE